MSVRLRALILKRIRSGDEDLLVKIYARCGLADMLVREALIVERNLSATFEPFNVVEVYCLERNGILLFEDVISVDRLSYMAKDFERFLWMSEVVNFVVKIRFYDPTIFELVLGYLSSFPRTYKRVALLKLKLDTLKISGLEPKFTLRKNFPKEATFSIKEGDLSQEGELRVRGPTLRFLKKLHQVKDPSRIKADESIIREADNLLNQLIQYHL